MDWDPTLQSRRTCPRKAQEVTSVLERSEFESLSRPRTDDVNGKT